MRIRSRRFCEACRAETEFHKPRIHHRRHLVATILTAGLWGIGWIIATGACHMAPWRCRRCEARKHDNVERLRTINLVH